jgi:cell division protein FtsQ
LTIAFKNKLILGLWLLIGLGILILFVAAMQKRKNGFCAGSRVEISANNQNYFITEKEVNEIINLGGDIQERTIQSIDLSSLETALENDLWVKNAELYFGNNDTLHVDIEQRQPIARLFAVTGSSVFIDKDALRLPIKNTASARVLTITSFPSDNQVLAHTDSLTLNKVKDLANFIYADTFWNSQIAQVDITSSGNFELIPAVGNHIIKFGDIDNMKEKFDRLMTFYTQAWTQNGMNTYEVIDVRFNNQIVATRKGTIARAAIDTANVGVLLDSLNAKADSLSRTVF